MTSASDMAAVSGAAGGSAAGAEKAAWYREVLDLEPGSKVFLPFARLLMELGRADEAVSVLRDGLERHPEFMEARLFLIDVLHKHGDMALCGAEVARLAGLFRSHPGFWDAWSDVSAAAGGKPDLTVSLSFLAALFRDEGLTLLDVLSAGLKSLRVTSVGRNEGTAPDVPHAPAPPPFEELPLAAPAGDFPARDRGEAASALPESPLAPVPPLVFGGDIARSDMPSDGPARDDEPPVSVPSPGPADGREKCSLRTRSMAEILAEQGDVRGAVDIYEELLVSCRLEDRAALLSRLEDLRARQGADGGAAPVVRASASAPARSVPPARNGVLDLLEKLAVRLETKARQ